MKRLRRLLVAAVQVVAYIFAVLVVVAGMRAPTRRWLPSLTELDAGLQILIIGVAISLGIVVVNLLMWRFGKSTLVWRGWPALGRSVRGFGFGSLVGLGMVVGMLGLTLLLGGGRIELGGGSFTQYLARVVPLLGCLLVAALGEEWLFRGYPLTKFASVVGPGWANVVMAILFSAAHGGETGFGSVIAFNILLGSLVVGTLRFSPGGIPAAWGMHAVWNGMQMLVGSTISGEDFGVPGVHLVGEGSALVSGGAFGPEGSIGATISTAIALVILGVYSRRRGHPDLPIPIGRTSDAVDTGTIHREA